MKMQQYAQLLALGIVSMSVSNQALANQCDQLSPLREALGEDYWNVDYAIERANEPSGQRATVTQESDAFSVLNIFDSYHYSKAIGTRHICKGAPDQRRVVVYDSALRLNTNSNHVLHNNTDTQRLEYLESAESEMDKISFDQFVIVDLPNESKWQVNSDQSLKTSQINQHRNSLGFTTLQQIDTELARTDEGIRLTQTLYFNGHRESWAIWTLIK